MDTGDSGSWTGRAEDVIRGLGVAEVVSYGEVAAEAGRPGAARAVGHLLSGATGLPWWRVVNASGRLVPGHEAEQARLLRAEGVEVIGSRVARFGRRPARSDANERRAERGR
jgi:alkylated DNA nucleotide flippase Atl1